MRCAIGWCGGMNWSEWKPFYTRIAKRLEIDIEGDYVAAMTLSDLIGNMDSEAILQQFDETIHDKEVIVFGSGPSLESHVSYVRESPRFKEAVIVAADGAISALLASELDCDYLVTDLDGDSQDILDSVSKGTLPIVHAHGDNIQMIRELVPRMNRLIGSTQVEPLSNVFLWGGFTDGDRACYLVSHYAPKRVILAGMDFGHVVGKWSKPGHEVHFPASERKRIKLEIAQELLTYLWTSRNIAWASIDEIRL